MIFHNPGKFIKLIYRLFHLKGSLQYKIGTSGVELAQISAFILHSGKDEQSLRYKR